MTDYDILFTVLVFKMELNANMDSIK